MGFDGGRADDQPLGDLGVVQAFDQQRQNGALALRQVVARAGGWLARRGSTPVRPRETVWCGRRAPRVGSKVHRQAFHIAVR